MTGMVNVGTTELASVDGGRSLKAVVIAAQAVVFVQTVRRLFGL